MHTYPYVFELADARARMSELLVDGTEGSVPTGLTTAEKVYYAGWRVDLAARAAEEERRLQAEVEAAEAARAEEEARREEAEEHQRAWDTVNAWRDPGLLEGAAASVSRGDAVVFETRPSPPVAGQAVEVRFQAKHLLCEVFESDLEDDVASQPQGGRC